MKQNQKLMNLRIPTELHTAAQETARQRCENLSAILRRYLEAYTASQPTKRTE